MHEKIRGDIEEVAPSKELKTYPETELINKKLQWFEDQKIGVIFHWGLYAEAGIVESWQLSEKDEWAREPKAWRDDIKTLQRDYWNLIDDFNPTHFNPTAWAKMCKGAGFRYMIFTTKHHDGFHMWNTVQSDYKICSHRSPCKVDLYKEVVDAFCNEGLGIGAYYSKADWHSPLYWSKPDTIKDRRADYSPTENPELWDKYVQYVHNELEEITQNYGSIDILWLDAGWCGKDPEDLRMDEIAEKVRKTNKDLLMVDRMMGGRHENYVTPERKIPSYDEIPKQTWESNIPLGNDWGYVPTDVYKSSREIILAIIDVVTKGGNIILGVGPKPDGTFTEESKSMMAEIGKWVSLCGEGIYETRALTDLAGDRTWKMTRKGDCYYGFYIISEEASSPTSLMIDHIEVEGKIIKNVATLDHQELVNFEEEKGAYQLMLPEREFPWSIIALKFEVAQDKDILSVEQ